MKEIKIIAFFHNWVRPILLPFMAAFFGGIVARSCVKIESPKQQPIPIDIEILQYEKKLNEIRGKRDSISVTVPTDQDAFRYLRNRYDREASANN